MIQKLTAPTMIEAAGNKLKKIEEFIGLVNSHTTEVSIARMTSPTGWTEPGQKPEFTEYTIVLKGLLLITTESGEIEVEAGEAVVVPPDEWIQYSTPNPGGAEYISVCLPAFSPETVHRDDE